MHTRARRPRTRRKPQVRTPPAHTPAETLQPRRGFHALREGFSPHPLSFCSSGRPNAPFSPRGRRGSLTGVGFLASSYVPSSVSGFRTPQLPLLTLWEKGVGGMRGNGAPESRKSLISPKKSTLERKGVGGMRGQTCTRGRDARAPGANLRCARLRRVPPQRRSSPAGASTRSGRAYGL